MAAGRLMLIDQDKRPAHIPHRFFFFFDEDAYNHLEWVFQGIRDDMDAIATWAKPPFESMYFEIDRPGQPIGCVVDGDTWYFILQADGKPLRLRPTFDYPTRTFTDSKPLDDEGREALRTIAVVAMTAMAILAQPSAHTLTRVDARSGISRGKRVAYRAHNTVTIHLGEAEKHLREILNGNRGPVRRHEVRGHWVNFHKVDGCEHRFLERDPFDGEHFKCVNCGQLRSWRKEFLRGDAAKGFVTKDYNVSI